MTSILDNLPPWPQLLFVLSRQLLKLDMANSFLTVPESESFIRALSSFESWKTFISSSEHLTTFRVRAMLFEQFVPYFSHHRPCCRSPLDLDELCRQAQDLQDTKSSPMPMSLAPEEEFPLSSNTDHVPLLDIYHTLEFDMAAMIEQRKLDEYQAQEEVHEEDPVTPFTIMDESDHFSLKYLLKGISENRNKTTLSDRELRNLLLDVKPHRSKWANDDKIGQEDLYEACEKVLTDLKNYTEHSTPFLSKVNKREAPDYFEVIKEPMDLGTVSKKLKHCQYKNKKEFGNDLYLIYENCLTYNTNPASEYRKHAIAMKRKTDRLLSRVPEISIKDRPENDLDDLDDSDEEEIKRGSTRERSMTHESFEESSQHHHHHYSGKHPQKGTPLKPLTELDKEHEELHTTDEIDSDMGELQNKIWREITKKTRAKLTTDVEKQYQFEFGNRNAIHRSSVDMERFSMLEHLHHQPECTKKLMRCSRTAFLRWIDRHEGFSVYDSFDLTSEDEDGFDGGFFFASTRKCERPPATDDDDAIRTDLFLPEYSMASGVPDIIGAPEEYIPYDNLEDEEDDSLPSMDIYPVTRPDPNGLLEIMQTNIKKLQTNRYIYDRCNSIRNNIPISNDTYPTSTHDSPPIMDMGTPIPSASRQTTPPPIMINKEASQQMLQRSLSQILEHAGFESAQSSAFNVLTDLMSEYFSNIGKTARKYWDQHGKDMSGEEILLHTLQENNVDSIDAIDNYVTEDVMKYTHRLNDTHRKLESTYQDLVSSSVLETANDESNLFRDDEAFITGVFGEDLGEDFFGFKELGLDQECNMRSLGVPSRLWFGKDKPKPMINTKPETKVKYTAPPAFLPITDATPLIGLLKAWYETRMDKPEDEYVVQKRGNRSRHPPVNVRSAYIQHQQLQIMKRRVLKDGSNTNQANEEAKRKRKRAIEESKAQKKKQKLEIKAQKLAEKEQKKKQREEEKLAKKKSTHV